MCETEVLCMYLADANDLRRQRDYDRSRSPYSRRAPDERQLSPRKTGLCFYLNDLMDTHLHFYYFMLSTLSHIVLIPMNIVCIYFCFSH